MSARTGGWLQLQSGRRFWPLDPRPGDFTIEDIAHGCAHESRYGGQTPRFYGVAQHSVLVSERAEQLAHAGLCADGKCRCAQVALWGLLHDASEGLGLKDIPAPLKQSLPDYLAVERRVMQAVCEKFRLAPEEPQEVAQADGEVFATEARDLFPKRKRPAEWGGLVHPPLAYAVVPWPIPASEGRYVSRCYELTWQIEQDARSRRRTRQWWLKPRTQP